MSFDRKTYQAEYQRRNAARLRSYKAEWANKKWASETERCREKQRVKRAKLRAAAVLRTRPVPAHCECCGGPPVGKGQKLHYDHDHKTGAFRGWLCSRCNTGIGLLGDNEAGIENARRYLALAELLA